MKKIVVASNNPVKIQAALNGFNRIFPDETFEATALEVPSGVSRQPGSDEETLRGARNRVAEARKRAPEADYWIGLEGGVGPSRVGMGEVDSGDKIAEMTAYAWIVVQSIDQTGESRTGAFTLPKAVADLVREGKELGEADDQVFGQTNSKQASGAIGLLTGGAVDRAQLYEQGVILALVPFKNPELYK
jgi:inosine/xanthosine triphosphatase